MIHAIGKVLTIISLVFVFFLFVFSMPVGENISDNYITGMYVQEDNVCDVFFTGHGRFYCEFGDVVCERLLYERCFGI